MTNTTKHSVVTMTGLDAQQADSLADNGTRCPAKINN